MDSHCLRTRFGASLTVATLAVTLAVTSPWAHAVEAIVPGQKLRGEVRANEELRFTLQGVRGSELTLKVNGSKKLGQRPVVRLFDPEGREVSTGDFEVRSRNGEKLSIVKLPLSETGDYDLLLSDEGGVAGTVKLLTKAKLPKRERGTLTVTEQDEVLEVGFDALVGDSARLVLRPVKRSALSPWIGSLVFESGDEVEVNDAKKSARVPITETGRHHFEVTGSDDGVGEVTYALSIGRVRAPRGMTDLRDFHVEDRELRDNAAIYADPGTTPIDVRLLIDPADNPESEEDTDCGFIDTTDGLGTTLADVNQDVDASDDCKPEVNVRATLPEVPAHGGVANAELRVRGHSTRNSPQKSYRLKLDSKEEAEQWRGQRYLLLNKHPYDLTRFRNKLAFDLFQDIPHITSLRTQFVRLWVDEADGNGETDFGLFTHVERYDKAFLRNHGLDPDGDLYKAENFEFFRYADQLRHQDDPLYDEDVFEQRIEVKAGGDDHAPFLAMLDALNDYEQDFDEVFDRYFDEDNYLTWFASSLLFDNRDTNSQNLFLYRASNSERFYILPWDYDGAFDFYGQPNEAAHPSLSRWQEGVHNWWNVVLHKRFLRQPGALEKLEARMVELKSVHATPTRVQALVDTYVPIVRQFLEREPDSARLPVVDRSNLTVQIEQFETEAQRMVGVVEQSYQSYLDTLDRPMPVFTDTVDFENEVEIRWDPSFDLQGHGLTYDIAIATHPAFAPEHIVAEANGLVDVTRTRFSRTVVTDGVYFLRVVVRDTADPVNHWQVSYDSYWDQVEDKVHFGVRRFEVGAQ